MADTDECLLHFDGASRGNPGPSAIGYRLSDGETTIEDGESIGYHTNNEAEYEALIKGLEIARDHGYLHITVIGDSELIVKQVSGEYSCNAQNLQPLHEKAVELAERFDTFEIQHTLRGGNARADGLANAALNQRRW